MSIQDQVRQSLQAIEQSMRDVLLWQAFTPEQAAFSSTEPFCIDSMSAQQWLQWVLLPRMYALLDANTALPANFMIAPYFEEALKNNQPNCLPLLAQLQHLDALLKR